MTAVAALDEIAKPDAPAGGDDRPDLRMLDALVGYGCDIARVIAERVEAADPAQPVAELQAAAMAYSRVARAVRLTLMLKAKLADRPAAVTQAHEADRSRDPVHMRKVRVERIIERVAKARHPDDEDEVDRLVIEAGERLDDDDLYGGVLQRPISELLALICRDLDLDLDWSRLAEEAWAKQELASGQPGWPLAPWAAAARPPPLAGEGVSPVIAEGDHANAFGKAEGREAVERAFRRDTG